MIRYDRICKTYTRGLFRKRSAKPALEGFSLSLGEGCFGLLGVNGAGKTTAIKIAATLLTPTSGSAKVLGLDPVSEAKVLRRRIGMITGSDRMHYFRLTARENLAYFAALYGLSGRRADVRISEVLEIVDLPDDGKRVEEYSRGMRQRLAIARGLLHDPDVLFLDEPTLGLDVQIAAQIRAFLKDRVSSRPGRAMILTSHALADIENLCPRIGILEAGRLIFEGSPADLSASLGLLPLHRVECVMPAAGVVHQDTVRDSIPEEVRHSAEIQPFEGGKLVISIRSASEAGIPLIAMLSTRGFRDIAYRREEPRLEDAVLTLARQGV